MSHGHVSPKTLRGLKIKRTILLKKLRLMAPHMQTGRHKMVWALENTDRRIADLESLKSNFAQRSKTGKAMANPLYWKKLQEASKKIGWRGEYQVVNWLRKRGWFAKRSFGSWGVDVFAAKGRETFLRDIAYTGKSDWSRSLLVDVKSSETWSADALRAKPVDPKILAESERTGVPIMRACCVKGQQPVFYWWSNQEMVPEGWFN